MNLPPFIHKQYFDSLIYGSGFKPYAEFTPNDKLSYRSTELTKFKLLFETDDTVYKNKRILDLGSHHGYLAYIVRYLGADSVHGINILNLSTAAANFAFSQMNQTNYLFETGDIENQSFLEQACKDKDTVMLCEILGGIKNPVSVLSTITDSSIDAMMFEGGIYSEYGQPALYYSTRDTTNRSQAGIPDHNNMGRVEVQSIPNLPWLTTMLYYFGWRIEHLEVTHDFTPEWFAMPKLAEAPRVAHNAHILARKFK